MVWSDPEYMYPQQHEPGPAGSVALRTCRRLRTVREAAWTVSLAVIGIAVALTLLVHFIQ